MATMKAWDPVSQSYKTVATVKVVQGSAQPKKYPWGSTNDPVIVNKSIPLNARPGSRYFCPRCAYFKGITNDSSSWNATSADVVCNCIITIPETFAADCANFYKLNDVDSVVDYLRSHGCIKKFDNYSGPTTSPNFVVENNKILCVRTLSFDDEINIINWFNLGKSSKRDVLSKLLYSLHNDETCIYSNIKSECIYNNNKDKYSRRERYRNKRKRGNPFYITLSGRHRKKSVKSTKFILINLKKHSGSYSYVIKKI